jgi:hypothetical protein
VVEPFDPARAEAEAARLLGRPVTLIGVLGGGRNSRVCEIVSGGRRLALKTYHRRRAGDRDYVAAEYDALCFLWGLGERRIPAPLAADARAGYLITEFVEGDAVTAAAATPADLDQCAAFIVSLRQATAVPGSRSLPPASEACLSPAMHLEHIERRLLRLETAADLDALDGRPRVFVAQELRLALEGATRHAAEALDGDTDFQAQLPLELQTLSPSDFGFHNCRRRPTGELVFLDFEHFGWDDPAKLVCDVLLHPGMGLGPAAGQHFAARACAGLGDARLPRRVDALLPLVGLKWCTILLNEFLPGDLARRTFAGRQGDRGAVQEAQLAKARKMLDLVTGHLQPAATGRVSGRCRKKLPPELVAASRSAGNG